MHYADDHYHTFFNTVKHPKRETAQECASGRSMDEVIAEWRFGKPHKNGESFNEEIAPQSALLLLVPRCRFGYVLFRLWADADLERHSRWRILVMTSFANGPRFLSSSYESSRRSSSAFCSVVSASACRSDAMLSHRSSTSLIRSSNGSICSLEFMTRARNIYWLTAYFRVCFPATPIYAVILSIPDQQPIRRSEQPRAREDAVEIVLIGSTEVWRLGHTL
jgi:hypothetical protein